MTIVLFLLKMIFVSGILCCYYWLLLRNKKFHQYNRFYLLSIPALAILVPLLNIHIPGVYENPGTGIKLLRAITTIGWEEEVVITAQKSWLHSLLSWPNIAFAVYIIVGLIIFYTLARSVFYILRLSEKYTYEKINDIKFYQTPEPGTPFSFLNNIFWNDKIDMNSEAGSLILRHELYHVNQKHTADTLSMEILCALFWFNPFFHLIKKELKAVHEFLADQYAVSGSNRYGYAELLVWKSVADNQINIANPFFNNQIKRRITMITQLKNTRYGYIRRVMALPLLFILFCAFGLKINKHKNANPFFFSRPITIVVDAGHGGMYDGSKSANGILEKDVNLSIAKKIQQLSKEYNVKVIMTRDNDATVGNASSLQEDLLNRVNVAESNKADLFISIHVDASTTDKSKNGFSIYLSNKNLYYQKSLALGSALTEEIKSTYPIAPELKERQEGIIVLKAPKMPAVLIECGYITNKNDLAFITDPKNQEKIARNILEGVEKYNAFLNKPTSGLNKDTISIEELKKINPDDISRMNVWKEKNIIVVNLKNGDSVIAKADEFQKYMADNKIRSEADSNIIFTKVEVEAEYPGGQKAWIEYLTKNFKYPEDAVKRKIQGTVVTQFIVETDGSVSDIKILDKPDPSFSEVCYNIIKNSGKWIPATEHGQKVRCYKKQPVVFKLDSK